MNNRKGFTLVELLVAVSILGIITGMSIPIIRNIRLDYEQKKYNQYGESLVVGAKLYRDSYDEDLFGRRDSGCRIVTYEQLHNKDLIKDFPDNNISCDSADTLVRVVKLKKQYGYSYQLYCGAKADNGKADDPKFKSSSFSKKVAEVTKINNDEEDDNYDENGFNIKSCNKNTVFEISADPDSGLEEQEKYDIKLKVSSYTGININVPVDIEYTWREIDSLGEEVADDDEETGDEVTGEDEEVEETSEEPAFDYSTLTGWKKAYFSSPSGKDRQEQTIADGNPVVLTSSKITTPSDHAGYYVLVVKVNSFQDLIGESWTDDDYLTFGVYNVAKKYTLTYDNNGGSGCTSKTVLVSKDDAGTKTWGTLCTPTRENYSFMGWNTTASGEEGYEIDEDTLIEGNLKVYARWERDAVVFKIKVYSGETLTSTTTANDGTKYGWKTNSDNILMRKVNSGNYSIYTITKNKGESVSLNLPDYNNSKFIKITKTGYKAVAGKEWLCESGCVNNDNTPKTGYTFSHSAITVNTNNFSPAHGTTTVYLRVNWVIDGVFVATLDQRSGTGGTTAVYEKYNTGWYSDASATTKINKITAPTRTGYTYGGYYTKVNGGGDKKISGTTLPGNTVISSNVTWYAKWTPKIFTISINHHSGTGGTAGPIYLKYNTGWYSDSGATKSISKITSANRTGYKLSGYYTATSGGTKIVNADGSIVSGKTKSYSANGTLHARWAANVYKVTLNKNGGSDGTSTIYEKYNDAWYKEQAATTKISKVTKPTKTGYNFNGYYTAKSGGTKIINAAGTIVSGKTKQFTSAGTLYAQWNVKTVTVTFNCNGGNGGGEQTFTYGKSGQKFSKTCTKTGHKQLGWAATNTATASTWNTASSVTNNWIDKYSPSITLYAVYNPGKPYYTNENKEFDHLQDAINNTSSGKIIYLSKNYDDASEATLSTNKTLTFDANGHTLNLTKNAIAVSKGTMTFINGTITTAASQRSAIKANGGIVNINNDSNKAITIKSNHKTDSYMNDEAIRIESGGVVNVKGSNTTIQSGTGSTSGYSRIVSIESGGGTFNMSDGKLIGDATKDGYGGSTGINAEHKGKINISGGSIVIKKLNHAYQCVICANDSTSVKLTKVNITVEKNSGLGNVFWAESSSSICYNSSQVSINKPNTLSLYWGNVSSSC